MDPVDALLADLARWAADTRADAAAHSRTLERWLKQQAIESARFTGLLVDMAEAGVAAVVRTGSGRTHTGRVCAIGRDFLVLRGGRDGPSAVFVAFAAVTSVRAAPGDGPLGIPTDRGAPLDSTLAGVLARLNGERVEVAVTAGDGGEQVRGELVAVGQDVLTIGVAGDGGNFVFVPVSAVRELLVV